MRSLSDVAIFPPVPLETDGARLRAILPETLICHSWDSNPGPANWDAAVWVRHYLHCIVIAPIELQPHRVMD